MVNAKQPKHAVPPAIVLEAGPVIYKSHNGFWFLVLRQSHSERSPPRPTGSPQQMLAGLGHHSQTQSGRVYGRKHLFRLEVKTYVQALSEQDYERVIRTLVRS